MPPETSHPVVAVKVLPHGEGLGLPAYASALAAGCDLEAAVPVDTPLVVPPGGRVLVPTGLAIAIEPGYEAQVRPRSGLALKHGVTVLNAPGTVDADYRGEVKVLLVNLGADPFRIERGMRIAQMIVAPVSRARFVPVAHLDMTVRARRRFRIDRNGKTADVMLLAKRGTLALAAVVDIALHARPEPVAAKSLAQRLGLPPRHLEPLLQVLVRSGILRGVRGPKGGYELARERRRISVAEILRASLSEPDEAPEAIPALIEHVVAPLVTEISTKVLDGFEEVTVDDLCTKALARTDVGGVSEPADFTI